MIGLVPGWAKWAALAAIAIGLYACGRSDGKAIAEKELMRFRMELAAANLQLSQAQAKVVTEVQIEYRDRIKTVYVKGDTITKEVPVYVTQADSDRCIVNTGFVRSHNAAWTGEVAGPAEQSDREPAGISLAAVAETDSINAATCRAWKEQALGLRDFYQRLQHATNQPPYIP